MHSLLFDQGAPGRGIDFVAPAGEFGRGSVRDDLECSAESFRRDGDRDADADRAARAPWRWEKLLVDAAVIGSRDRWDRRLAGLEAEMRQRRDAL